MISLDLEWVHGSKVDCPPKGQDRVALAQIGFVFAPGDQNTKQMRALLMHVRGLTKTPSELLPLFMDEKV